MSASTNMTEFDVARRFEQRKINGPLCFCKASSHEQVSAWSAVPVTHWVTARCTRSTSKWYQHYNNSETAAMN